MSRGPFVVLLVSAAAAVAGVKLATADRPAAFLIGDCPYYAATAESLLRDGDFDLRNQLDPDGTGLRPHSGFFAVGPDNSIVPKHSTLMPIASVPLLAAFGTLGFLVFNVAQVCVLVYGIAVLGGGTPAARLAALVGYLTTPFLAYTFNYSPDVFGAALVVWAYVAAARGRWAWCGLLAGLAVWAKVYLAVVLLPAAVLAVPGGRRAVLTAGARAAVALALMLAINTALYSGPLATGYDREARVTDAGELVTADHYSRFNQPVLPGLGNLLFDGRIGLLQTAPVWFLWPAGAWMLWRAGGADRRRAAALSLAILANLLLFARYDEWDATVFGNRFLFPALALGLALQEPVWRRVTGGGSVAGR